MKLFVLALLALLCVQLATADESESDEDAFDGDFPGNHRRKYGESESDGDTLGVDSRSNTKRNPGMKGKQPPGKGNNFWKKPKRIGKKEGFSSSASFLNYDFGPVYVRAALPSIFQRDGHWEWSGTLSTVSGNPDLFLFRPTYLSPDRPEDVEEFLYVRRVVPKSDKSPDPVGVAGVLKRTSFGGRDILSFCIKQSAPSPKQGANMLAVYMYKLKPLIYLYAAVPPLAGLEESSGRAGQLKESQFPDVFIFEPARSEEVSKDPEPFRLWDNPKSLKRNRMYPDLRMNTMGRLPSILPTIYLTRVTPMSEEEMLARWKNDKFPNMFPPGQKRVSDVMPASVEPVRLVQVHGFDDLFAIVPSSSGGSKGAKKRSRMDHDARMHTIFGPTLKSNGGYQLIDK